MTRTISFSQGEFHEEYESHRDSIIRAGRRFDEAMKLGNYSAAVHAYNGVKSLADSFTRKIKSQEVLPEYSLFNTEFSERLRIMEQRLNDLGGSRC